MMTIFDLDLSNYKIYIEAGANDGISQSRSLHLSRKEDWFGVLIEPHPMLYQASVHQRSNGRTLFVNCGLVSNDYKESHIDLYCHSEYSLMNCVSDSIMMKRNPDNYNNPMSVPAKTLQSILDDLKIKVVDYFFLDVEGYEKEVINGIGKNTIIKRLELEQHNKENFEQEKCEIIQNCKQLNLEYNFTISTSPNESRPNPKLVFDYQKEQNNGKTKT